MRSLLIFLGNYPTAVHQICRYVDNVLYQRLDIYIAIDSVNYSDMLRYCDLLSSRYVDIVISYHVDM